MSDDDKPDPLGDLERWLGLSYFEMFTLYGGFRILRKRGPLVKTWFTDFWNDPAKFTGVVRAAVAVICAAIVNGEIVLPGKLGQYGWLFASLLGPAAIGISAGQKNQSIGEIKAIAQDPAVKVTPADVAKVDAEKVVAKDAAKP